MGLTVESYAQRIGLPADFLRLLGVRERRALGVSWLNLPYYDAYGRLTGLRYLAEMEGANEQRWRQPSRAVLYGLERLVRYRDKARVVITFDEHDCHSLWFHDVPAFGLPPYFGWNAKSIEDVLDAFGDILLVKPPEALNRLVEEILTHVSFRDRVRLLDLGPYPHLNALYQDAPQDFKQRFEEAATRAQPFFGRACTVTGETPEALAARVHDLAREGDFFERLDASMAKAGIFGELRNQRLLYLILTTALTRRPVSAAIKGPSAGGKSSLLLSVLEHFPREAFVMFSGMSASTLLQFGKGLVHRHLVALDLSLVDSPKQRALLRALASDGRLMWQAAGQGLQSVKHFAVEGPTGIVFTTSHLSLPEEREGRLLPLTVKDTRTQTRGVMKLVAEPCIAAVDPVWPAFQTWLRHGERRVHVPFAAELAEATDAAAVNMRRSFAQVLSLVEAHALIHRERRGRDAEGRIVATEADYLGVRALCSDLIAQSALEAVPRTIRETVDVVQRRWNHYNCGISDIANDLGIDVSAAGRRCRAALAAGFIIRDRRPKGERLRFALGLPLPDDRSVLPKQLNMSPQRVMGQETAANLT